MVALDSEARAATASSQLFVSSVTGVVCCRRPGGRALLSARGRILSVCARLRHGTAGFLLLCGRVNELLNALGHAVALVALQVVQLVCCRLGRV